MEPGYAYKRVRGQWDTVVISTKVADRARFKGYKDIDGTRMALFTLERVTYAQLPQNLRRIGHASRYASRRSRHGNAMKAETYRVFAMNKPDSPALGEVRATRLGDAVDKARAKYGPNVMAWVVDARGRSAGDPRHASRARTRGGRTLAAGTPTMRFHAPGVWRTVRPAAAALRSKSTGGTVTIRGETWELFSGRSGIYAQPFGDRRRARK
jgi:hypothetical protein